MAPGIQALQDGVYGHHANAFGQTITVLSGPGINREVIGIIAHQEIIDPEMPLGRDPRMASILEIAPQSPAAPPFQGQETIRSEDGTRYKIVELLDNDPSSITKRYRLEQQL